MRILKMFIKKLSTQHILSNTLISHKSIKKSIPSNLKQEIHPKTFIKKKSKKNWRKVSWNKLKRNEVLFNKVIIIRSLGCLEAYPVSLYFYPRYELLKQLIKIKLMTYYAWVETPHQVFISDYLLNLWKFKT